MPEPASSPCGLVVANNRVSAEAGVAMLKAGGNAIDAAIAAALMEAVASPHNCGIGGYGGCMVIYLAREKREVAINFNCVAPMKATPDMFFGQGDANRVGPLAVAVPGVLRGFEAAVTKFGKLKWSEVVAPAQQRAEEGVVVTTGLAAVIRNSAARMQRFPSTAAMFLPNHRPPQAGERLRFPELAQSLKLIAREGANVFYAGEIAQHIVGYLQSLGGLLTVEEFAKYQPTIGPPLSINLRSPLHRGGGRPGVGLHTPPLPGGGATALQILRVLERLPLPAPTSSPESADYLHFVIEAMKLAWRERVTQLGDPAFVKVPLEKLLSEAHAKDLAQQVIDDKVPKDFKRDADESCTTHLCAADPEGNLVSLTHTHGESFGSLVTAPGTGIVLGHGMSRFDVTPGRANSVAPGKQPLHNMSPLLITSPPDPLSGEERGRNGWTAVLGVPGGPRIPNVVVQMTMQLLHFNANLAEAVAAPRVHCEIVEPVQVEKSMAAATIGALQQRGHEMRVVNQVGGLASGIVWDEKTRMMHGAADPRGAGVAVAV